MFTMIKQFIQLTYTTINLYKTVQLKYFIQHKYISTEISLQPDLMRVIRQWIYFNYSCFQIKICTSSDCSERDVSCSPRILICCQPSASRSIAWEGLREEHIAPAQEETSLQPRWDPGIRHWLHLQFCKESLQNLFPKTLWEVGKHLCLRYQVIQAKSVGLFVCWSICLMFLQDKDQSTNTFKVTVKALKTWSELWNHLDLSQHFMLIF